MGRVNWTHEAETWLRDIYDYIARDNPEAALRVVGEIVEKAQDLAQFPEMGHRYEGVSDRNGALDIKRYLF